jgi:hypothetical protein
MSTIFFSFDLQKEIKLVSRSRNNVGKKCLPNKKDSEKEENLRSCLPLFLRINSF